MKLYKALILPTATYAAETWIIKSENSRKFGAFEMRYQRAIFGVKLRDRVRNEVVRTALHVNTTITDSIKTKRLKWFGHVTRRPAESYPCVRPRLSKSKTTRPTAKEMVHQNPRGYRPATGDSRTSERLVCQREIMERARIWRGVRPKVSKSRRIGFCHNLVPFLSSSEAQF